ncbi:hypothetical protein LSAT2_005335 [Lamellibrachia satsuma]|nr:hypothetical protein LSAT2_005335 [Lamellibrachia satsuma]
MLDLDQESRITAADMKSIRVIQGVTNFYKESKIAPTVKVIKGTETERKVQVTIDQQHQQPPGGRETERKTHVTMDQQHQQPPGGRETERKVQVTIDQQHQQPPGEKEHQPQRCSKNGRYKNRTEWRELISSVIPNWSRLTLAAFLLTSLVVIGYQDATAIFAIPVNGELVDCGIDCVDKYLSCRFSIMKISDDMVCKPMLKSCARDCRREVDRAEKENDSEKEGATED